MFSISKRVLSISIILFLIIQLSSGQVTGPDKTLIGVKEGEQYQGFVLFVYINQSGTRGIFGQNLEDISLGDKTKVITINSIDNTTGDINLHHTNYGLPGWEADSNLATMCSNAVYTDWDYWRNKHEDSINNSGLPGQFIVETEDYYGYIFEAEGSQTDANGVTTPTWNRNDCVYNKQTGFREFFGLYSEVHYPNAVEVVYQAEQFLPDPVDNKNVNPDAYFDLVTALNTTVDPPLGPIPDLPTVSPPTSSRTSDSKQTTTSTSTGTQDETRSQEESNGDISLDFPFMAALIPIFVFIKFKRKEN